MLDDREKKEILRGLLLTEEDTLERLRELINKAKALIRIDEKSSKTILEETFVNRDKILLLLIGKYFSKELGIVDTEGMTLSELEKESGAKKTSLSRPLLELSQAGYIGQDADGRYFVHYYRVESVVNALNEKYIQKVPDSKGLKLQQYRPKRKRKAV